MATDLTVAIKEAEEKHKNFDTAIRINLALCLLADLAPTFC